MKSKKTLSKKLVQFAVILGVVTATWSCAGNGNSTDANNNNKDSTSVKDNTMNTPTNATEQNGRMTDTMKTNTGGDTKTNTGSDNKSNAGADAAFMMKAAEINMEEIKLGKLAQQKGTMAHVKELGKMMATEHTQAMEGLTALAKTKMTTIPATESEKAKNDYKMLSEESGKDFDKAYSDMMVKGHKEAIELFEKTAMDTKDAEIKSMATAMIPKLKTHLEHSEMCQKECKKM